MSDQAGKPIDLNEKVDIGLGVLSGKVAMQWGTPRSHIVFEPQNAFEFAEHLARAAHRARFPGDRMPDDFSYLAQQVRERLTQELRDRLAVRVRTMLPSLLERKDMNYASIKIVDVIFSALDPESGTRL